MSSFSERLKKAMANKGMRQSELSQITGLDKSLISNYLKGTYQAKQNNLHLIALALNVSEAWLMGYDVPMEAVDTDLNSSGGDDDTEVCVGIGEIINDYLKENGMSQRQFAKSCGLSNGYISMLIKNKNSCTGRPMIPSLSSLLGIAKALGMTPHQLLKKIDSEQIDPKEAEYLDAMLCPKRISSFPARLDEAMNGMSVTEMSAKLGISKQSVSAYLNGKRKPKPLSLTAMAHILSVDPEWLSGYDVPDAHTVRELKTNSATPRFSKEDAILAIALWNTLDNVEEQDIEDVKRFAAFIREKKTNK